MWYWVVLLLLRYAFEFALSLSAIGQAALIGKNSGRVVIVLNPNAVQVLVEGPPLLANSPEGGTNGPRGFRNSNRSSIRFLLTQFFGVKVSEGSMPDVQYPDGLACLVHFIENAIDVLALTEKKTSDFPSRFLRFTSERTSIG